MRLGRTCDRKHAAYGEGLFKVGEVMKMMWPEGVPEDQLQDAAVTARVLDKLFRIAATRPEKGDPMREDPWGDIAGYGLIMSERNAALVDIPDYDDVYKNGYKGQAPKADFP
jgi:hypothetical protein